MKEKNHLPLMGVGPVYVVVIIALTVAGILATAFNVIELISLEKWLADLYGSEYIEYYKRVNRCIPFFRKKF